MNYSAKEGEEKLSVHMENKNSFIVTKVTSTGPNCTQVLRLMHTMPQVGTLDAPDFIQLIPKLKRKKISNYQA